MALGVVRTEQLGPGHAGQDGSKLPGQVVCALDGRVGSPGLEGRHGVRGVADEKDSSALELVGYPLVGLPCGDIHDLQVDLLADCLGKYLRAPLRSELLGGFAFVGEVGGDEYAKVALDDQEYALHISVLDLYAIAIPYVRH